MFGSRTCRFRWLFGDNLKNDFTVFFPVTYNKHTYQRVTLIVFYFQTANRVKPGPDASNFVLYQQIPHIDQNSFYSKCSHFWKDIFTSYQTDIISFHFRITIQKNLSYFSTQSFSLKPTQTPINPSIISGGSSQSRTASMAGYLAAQHQSIALYITWAPPALITPPHAQLVILLHTTWTCANIKLCKILCVCSC